MLLLLLLRAQKKSTTDVYVNVHAISQCFWNENPMETPSMTHAMHTVFHHSAIPSRNSLAASDPKAGLFARLHHPEAVFSGIRSQRLVGM